MAVSSIRTESGLAPFVLALAVHCTWGTYDGKNAPDASTDSPGDVHVAQPVDCNPGPCSPGTTCCIPQGGGGPFCAGPTGCVKGTLMECTSSASCAGSEVCCIGPSDAGAQYQLSCVSSSLQCPPSQTACSGGNDCPGGGSCLVSGGCRFNVGVCSGTTTACNPQ